MANIKGKPRIVKVRQGKMDERTYENISKIVDNEMKHYEKFPPFKRAETGWQKFLSLFMNYRWARRLLRGKFVRGKEFGTWLWCDEKNFNPDLLRQVDGYEVWD